uniref:Uncharacterized protein n=1 Tax=Arundo donax TaxID=35708 RepID=A0A0A9H2F5_ARUDO
MLLTGTLHLCTIDHSLVSLWILQLRCVGLRSISEPRAMGKVGDRVVVGAMDRACSLVYFVSRAHCF